jgi:hypothetical protein
LDIVELAEHARKYFVQDRRLPQKPGEEGNLFYKTKDRHPKWIHDLVFRIHDEGQWFPDDYKYEYLVDALDALSEGIDPDEPQIEADPYNHDLITWLASHGERAGIVDEAVVDFGRSDQGIIGDIASGQVYEKEGIFRSVVDALRARLEAIEEGEPERFVEKGGEPSGPKEWSPR